MIKYPARPGGVTVCDNLETSESSEHARAGPGVFAAKSGGDCRSHESERAPAAGRQSVTVPRGGTVTVLPDSELGVRTVTQP